MTSRAAHTSGTRLKNTKVALKKMVLSFSIRVFLGDAVGWYYSSWYLILLRVR